MNSNGTVPMVEHYQGAMVFSAVGDALGWPTEFVRPGGRKPSFPLPLHNFVRWQKLVGGRWWGYRDTILPGSYSDDTQLTLAVARSITSSGDFQPQRFAYEELPLWLHYERGGGRSIKLAAHTLLRRQTDWFGNFYRQGNLDYRQAGANGAAMRNLPIALVSLGNTERLVRDSFFNAIISHGHPRAILGAILYGLAVQYILTETQPSVVDILDALHDGINTVDRFVENDAQVTAWIERWESRIKAPKDTFRNLFTDVQNELRRYLVAIPEFLSEPPEHYYQFIGALAPTTKGSGVATVCAAIFLFLRDELSLDERLYTAVNLLGSDTDTIAAILGALLGARYGLTAIPAHLGDKVQDREYLLKVASRLYAIATDVPSTIVESNGPLEKQEAYLRILAWEIGLHEMFWDAIEIKGKVIHPTLGRGTIVDKSVREIAREGYEAKLIYIDFDCGQTCIFHSRVENNDKVSESLAREVDKALG